MQYVAPVLAWMNHSIRSTEWTVAEKTLILVVIARMLLTTLDSGFVKTGNVIFDRTCKTIKHPNRSYSKLNGIIPRVELPVHAERLPLGKAAGVRALGATQ